jgi:hypothetical protein
MMRWVDEWMDGWMDGWMGGLEVMIGAGIKGLIDCLVI